MPDGRILIAVLGVYAAASAASFAAYAIDKRAAAAGRPRTRERTLHLIDLFFGWPGGLAAQRIVRHKNRKGRYQAVFWATVLLHAGVWVWVLRW